MNIRSDWYDNSEFSKLLLFLGLFIAIGAIFSSCVYTVHADTPGLVNSSYPKSVIDDQNKSVILSSEPQRIISLAPSNTEILFSLGLDDRIIGDTDYCNYPEEAEKKSKIGGFSTVSLEKVMALKPDLVVAADGNNPDTIERIRELGIPVYYTDAGDLSDVLKAIKNLGYLTGTDNKAEEICQNLTTRQGVIQKKSDEMKSHPTVAHVIWYDPIYVSGKNTFQDELINVAGGVNVFDSKDGHQIASIEDFINKNPDILLVNSGSGMGSNGSAISDYFKSDKRLSNLKAVKNNNIIMVDSDVADRAGPRLWDFLETLAQDIQAYK